MYTFFISGLFFNETTGDHVVILILSLKMGFGDLKSKAGQQALNTYLADRSYIEGCDFHAF